MPADLAAQRRFFAEEIEAVCHLRTGALVEALATVPREAFLPPGPWTIRGEGDIGEPPRQTPDADPRRVYHNVSIALDPARLLFNGAPGVVATCLDRLGLKPGDTALHVGAGAGYYTALMAQVVGGRGRVIGVEIDRDLADAARRNLAAFQQVEVRQGDGVSGVAATCFDAILVNAGTTHPHAAWLSALKPHGRLVLPLTVTLGQMGPIGKGVQVLLTKGADDGDLSARTLGMVAIYSAVGIRDDALDERLRAAYARGPWPTFSRLRRDVHVRSSACWLHGDGFCLSS